MKTLRQKLRRLRGPEALTFVATLFLATSFQNCAAPFATTGPDEIDMFSIDYFYKREPKFYVDTQLLQEKSAAPSLTQFRVAVNIASATRLATPIAYDISLTNGDGDKVCPQQQGSLVVGASFLYFDCTSPFEVSDLVVKVKATSGTLTETFDLETGL